MVLTIDDKLNVLLSEVCFRLKKMRVMPRLLSFYSDRPHHRAPKSDWIREQRKRGRGPKVSPEVALSPEEFSGPSTSSTEAGATNLILDNLGNF